MSEARARETRRAVRRLAGDQAIAILEHQSAQLLQHRADLRLHRQSLEGLSAAQQALADRIAALERSKPSTLDRWRATLGTWFRYAVAGKHGQPLEQRTGDESL